METIVGQTVPPSRLPIAVKRRVGGHASDAHLLEECVRISVEPTWMTGLNGDSCRQDLMRLIEERASAIRVESKLRRELYKHDVQLVTQPRDFFSKVFQQLVSTN